MPIVINEIEILEKPEQPAPDIQKGQGTAPPVIAETWLNLARDEHGRQRRRQAD